MTIDPHQTSSGRRAGAGALVLAAAAVLLSGATAAFGQLLAKVEPAWSPFATQPAPPELANLVTEARGLLAADPGRVAQVLSAPQPSPRPVGNLVTGLRADALYLSGGNSLLEAAKLYRLVVTSDPSAAEGAWAHFMLGNIGKVLGFRQEAETAYKTAETGEPGPWAAALEFDLAAMALEAGRYKEARDRLTAWLGAYPNQPGRTIATFLAGECHAALGDFEAARADFVDAARLDPKGWLPRPETGYALADVMRRDGRTADAVQVLEALAEAVPGTQTAARARLEIGEIWQLKGEVPQAARSYARLLDSAVTRKEGREALLRIALLGAEFADRIELTEAYPAYRVFYRPEPTLGEFAGGRDPLFAQRALYGLAQISRKAGRTYEALTLLSKIFRRYPETPESGRAYESFISTLEDHLAHRFAEGKYAEVVELYETLRKSMGWVATRDIGGLTLRAAEACDALGTPAEARRLYEELQQSPTRAIDADDLKTRIARTRLRSGEEGALRRWLEAHGDDSRARLQLARSLMDRGEVEEARRNFLAAARASGKSEEKLAALTEAERSRLLKAAPSELLRGLEQRRAVWRALPAGPLRESWERHGRTVEARLRFASGDYEGAAQLFRELPERTADDTYLLALAETRAGNAAAARESLEGIARGQDPILSSLATLHLHGLGLKDSIRGAF
jgi:tetratricopeptide (TPR) repeat protein